MNIEELAKEAGIEYDPEWDWFKLKPADFENAVRLVAERCAGIIEAQDVDPAFKNRMAYSIRHEFGLG